jgi:hemerythrin
MDMRCELPIHYTDVIFENPGAEYASLAEHRQRVLALIGKFQRAATQPESLKEAIQILQAILSCSRAYFAFVESLLDKITAVGAAPHRVEHCRILAEMEDTLDRCAAPGAQPIVADVAHALDALVIHEATIRLRESTGVTSTL